MATCTICKQTIRMVKKNEQAKVKFTASIISCEGIDRITVKSMQNRCLNFEKGVVLYKSATVPFFTE